MSIAAEWAGFRTVFFSEIESYCCRLLAERWPGIPNLGDIRTADFSGIRGGITVLSAGVPCQPASLAGKRRGKADDRWLWEAALDVVGVVEPSWVVFENPVGILSLGEFGGVLLRLGTLGYAVRVFSVPANAVGAKHRRQRVFVVAQSECGNGDGGRAGWGEADGERSCDAVERSGADAEAMADAAGKGNGQESGGMGRGASFSCGQRAEFADEFVSGGEVVVDADGARLEEHKSRQPGQRETIERSSGFDGTREPQSGVCGSFNGVSGWPYPLTLERISNRSHRLKALGNTVVPQQVYPFFEAIAQIEYGTWKTRK
jgi:DNA (cytosine-5)-methyltransferase 1